MNPSSPLPQTTESWADLRARFSSMLGSTEPVPAAVLRRALVDEIFAHRLLVSRNSPAFLTALFQDPRNKAFEEEGPQLGNSSPITPKEAVSIESEAVVPRSNLELIGRATQALFRWAKTGFTQVDEATYQKRLAACRACTHLIEPPEKLVYKILPGHADDKKICNLCGCVAARKARIPSESWPAKHPLEPGLNRWGEPAGSPSATQV